MIDPFESIATAQGAEPPPSPLSVLTGLESSLVASQRALLARDLPGLEKHTAGQRGILPQLHRLAADASRRSASVTDSQLMTALRAVQERVQALGRVQQALLNRAQRSLQVITNVTAGSVAVYRPVLGQPGVSVHAFSLERGNSSSAEA